MTTGVIQLYEKYYIRREYEQVDLFRLLKSTFAVNNAIYPGSYIQISPSFIFTDVVFIDTDKKAKRFFNDDSVIEYIRRRKEYSENPRISFHGCDYRELIDDLKGKFDLLISQYSGFISESCKEYLRPGGYLLVNNSHGDAGLASIDNDYTLAAAVMRSQGKYRISFSKLDEYFIPKKNIAVTKEYLYKTGRGVGYTRTAPLYIFRRVTRGAAR